MIAAVDRPAFGELPESLDQVQIGRVRRQEQERDPQVRGQRHHHRVPLVTRIVEHQGDRSRQSLRRDLAQELAHRVGVDHRGVGHGHQLTSQRVPRAAHVEPLPPRGRPHEEPRERPQVARERAEHKMGRVDEEHVSLPRLRGVQRGLQFFVEKSSLIGGMLDEVFLGGTGMARTRCHLSPMPFKN